MTSRANPIYNRNDFGYPPSDVEASVSVETIVLMDEHPKKVSAAGM